MDDNTAALPSEAVHQDRANNQAPDPREHYGSPEQLADDDALAISERHALLQEWKYDLEQRLSANSEGMAASSPSDGNEYARLAAELRRVSNASDRLSEAGDAL